MLLKALAVTIPLYTTARFSQTGFSKSVRKTVMFEYRVYVINNAGKIIERIDLECPNDDKAVSGGKVYARNNDVEVWCGQRIVRTINPFT